MMCQGIVSSLVDADDIGEERGHDLLISSSFNVEESFADGLTRLMTRL